MRRPSARTIHHRRGLTLVELLTAMAIVILLAAITVPTVATLLRGDRLRSASASVQGMLTAARERATLDGAPRGIRLIPEVDNPEICRQVIMIREAPPITPGSSTGGGAIVSNRLNSLFYDTVEVEYDRTLFNALDTEQPLQVVNIPRHSLNNVTVARGVMRIAHAGPFRSFSFVINAPNTANRYNSQNQLNLDTDPEPERILLILDEPLDGPRGVDLYGSGLSTNPTLATSGLTLELMRPPVPLEGAEPLVLPAGIVIDLGSLPKSTDSVNPPTTPIPAASLRLTRLTPRLTVGVPIDRANPSVVDYGFEVMFSEDREVIGPASIDERVVLWLRDEASVLAEPNPQSEILDTTGAAIPNLHRKEIRASSTASNSLVVLNTRTGEVGAFKPVLVDERDDSVGAATTQTLPNPDDWYDWGRYYENVTNGVGVND